MQFEVLLIKIEANSYLQTRNNIVSILFTNEKVNFLHSIKLKVMKSFSRHLSVQSKNVIQIYTIEC